MIDPVRKLISRLDRERAPIVTPAELRRWPGDAVAFLKNTGILREISPAESLFYGGCDEGCVITPDLVENPGTGRAVAVHYCKRDGCGRITFDPDELRRWQPDTASMASFVANQLDLATSATPLVPERIYLLGVIATSSGPLDVFLGRGLTWDDAPALIERADRLTRSTGPVLVVLRDIPPSGLWCGLRPMVVALWESVSWNEAESFIDFGSLAATVRSLRPPVPESDWLTVSRCAELLLTDVSGLDLNKAKARVSWAAGKGKFRTNGATGNARRIDRHSFSTWRLEQRERDLDADEEPE